MSLLAVGHVARRFVAHPAGRLLLSVVAFAAVTAGLSALWSTLAIENNELMAFVPTIAALLALVSVGKFVERRSLAQVGFPFRPALAHLGKGLALGALLQIFVVLTLVLTGCYDLRKGPFDSFSMQLVGPVLLSFAWNALQALWEEVLFRGIVFRLLDEWVGTWLALTVSAVLFGLAHLLAPNSSLVAAVAIALEAGVLLGVAYVVTRDLWLAIGTHWGWNFFQGRVFGSSVSGSAAEESIFSFSVSGPDWLTGGAFGPEAGLPAVFFCVAAAVMLAAIAIRKGLVRPPRWAGRSTRTATEVSPISP